MWSDAGTRETPANRSDHKEGCVREPLRFIRREVARSGCQADAPQATRPERRGVPSLGRSSKRRRAPTNPLQPVVTTPAVATGPLFPLRLIAQFADDRELAGLKLTLLAGLVMLAAMRAM